MKKLIVFFALSLSLHAHADTQADVALVRSLAQPGMDIAQVQTAVLQGESEADAFELGKNNYMIRDFNHDGINDILVIFEQNPSLQDDQGKACPKEDWATHCYFSYGDRVLQFWAGRADGSFVKVSENSAIVMRADDGGVFGEPLNGLRLNKKGSVILSFYGGSAWRWGYDYTLQFRSDDFYLVGTDSLYTWNVDGRFETTSTNLVTGVKIYSIAKTGNSKVRTKTTKFVPAPLAALAQVQPISDPSEL